MVRLVIAENRLREVEMETPIHELVTEKREQSMRSLARLDQTVGVLASLGVYLSVEDVNLNMVKVFTDDYDCKQRTIHTGTTSPGPN